MPSELVSRPLSRRRLLGGALGGVVGAAALPLVSRPAAAKPAVQANETIDFWYWGTPTILDGFAKAIEAFEAANPGVKVNATTAPYGDFYQKLQPNLAAGSQPDLSLMEALNLVTYKNRDFIQSWEPYIQDLDLSQFYPVLFDELNRIPFGPSGELWGLPIYQHTWVLVYNKEIFDKAGVKYPDASWTWQTWEETAAQLTGGDVFGWGGGSGFYDPWVNMVQQGKNMLDDAHQVVQFDSPEGVQAVQHLANLYRSSGGMNNADLKAMNVPFILTGQVAMDTTHTHNLTQDAFTTSEVPWDLAVYPPQANAQLPKACMGFGDSLVLYSKAKNPEGAAALAKFLLGDPFQSEIVTSWGLMPILQSAMGAFLEHAPAGRAFAAAAEQLPYMRSFQVTDDFYGWYGEIFDALLPALDKQTPPEEIAKTLGTNANNKLQEILQRS